MGWGTLNSACRQDLLHAPTMSTPSEQGGTAEADEGSKKGGPPQVDGDQPSDVEKSGEEDDEEEDDEGSEDSEARTGDAGEGQTDVTVNGEEGETGDVAAGTGTNMTADTDGGSAVKTVFKTRG